MSIISVANQKGGVGKTAITVNAGIELSRQGKKVLIVDLDPQNHSGLILAEEKTENGYFDEADCKASVVCLFNTVTKPEPLQINENLFVIGSSKKAANPSQDNIFNLADCLDLIKDEFDYVLLDCPPAVGVIQHGALGISDKVLIISGLDNLSLVGVKALVNTTRQIKRRINPNLEILGIMVNRVRKNNNANDIYETKLRTEYNDLVFESMITDTVTLRNALDKQQSICQYNKREAKAYGATGAFNEMFTRLGVVEAA